MMSLPKYGNVHIWEMMSLHRRQWLFRWEESDGEMRDQFPRQVYLAFD